MIDKGTFETKIMGLCANKIKPIESVYWLVMYTVVIYRYSSSDFVIELFLLTAICARNPLESPLMCDPVPRTMKGLEWSLWCFSRHNGASYAWLCLVLHLASGEE